MKQRNTVFLSLLLGVGFGLTPLLALDTPQQTPPTSRQQAPAFAGQLVDASCRMNSPSGKCEVTESTTTFGLQTSDGKYYQLDGEGNSKVLTALKSSGEKTGAINVSIDGTAKGQTLTVNTVQIR